MPVLRSPARLVAATATAGAALLVAGVASAGAQPAAAHHPLPGVARLTVNGNHPASYDPAQSTGSGGRHEGDALEVADQAEAYANERSAPATHVPAQALLAAVRHARQMSVAKAKATEVTTKNYDAEPPGYTDPYWSNLGSGFRDVSGRATALAVDGDTYYLGTADGGVWKSTNAGTTWRSIWDNQAVLSIGALMIGANHSLWVGTGEANTNSDSYRGIGVFRSTNGGKSFQRVGGSELLDHQTYALRRDLNGHVYAATSQGLYRHSATTTTGAWELVLRPEPNPTGSPYATSFITDVQIQPGTHGQVVLAADGWRNGDPYNGFYESTSGGGAGSFQELNLTGDIDPTDIGRTTFAYAKDGSRLYAIVQSPAMLLANGATNLQGVFVSANGDPAGPWTKIADSDSLGASGSALQNLPGYHVGVQAWYNQALAVDPKDPMHAYVSLEEVFQTNDGGQTFTTASPYWNYGLACGDTCPPVTHPDQHALALTDSGKVVIGNDGGIYQRPMSVTGYGHWKDLNHGLDTYQYYDADTGKVGSGLAYWGGLQDNGTSVLNPGAKRMIEPAGGDGGMVLVDPHNGQRSVGEYTDLAMYRTEDGGHSFTTISPLCGYYNGSDCDPSARFIAPFTADVHDINHWVAAGEKVWDSSKGWNTTCAGNTCDWTPVWDLSAAHGDGTVGTALAVSGTTTYAAWVAGGGNPGPSFEAGIDTNYGGSWHSIESPVLPNRYIQGLTVDPNDPAHVFAIYNGYSRRWIPEGGVGTVFESTDGGSTWRNITKNLPDAPGDGLAIAGGKLVLGTDIGMFVANEHGVRTWRRVAGVPNVVVNNVRTISGTNTVVAGTHGRGIWRVTVH